MYLKITLLFLFVILSACGTTAKNIKKGQVLKENEGILLTTLQGNFDFGLGFKNSSGDLYYTDGKIGKNNKLLVAMNIPKGRYALKKINYHRIERTYYDNKEPGLTIEAGKINYTCDLVAYFKSGGADIFGTKEPPLFKSLIPIDLRNETYREFKKMYPVISKKYPLAISPISKCISGKSKNAINILNLINSTKI